MPTSSVVWIVVGILAIIALIIFIVTRVDVKGALDAAVAPVLFAGRGRLGRGSG